MVPLRIFVVRLSIEAILTKLPTQRNRPMKSGNRNGSRKDSTRSRIVPAPWGTGRYSGTQNYGEHGWSLDRTIHSRRKTRSGRNSTLLRLTGPRMTTRDGTAVESQQLIGPLCASLRVTLRKSTKRRSNHSRISPLHTKKHDALLFARSANLTGQESQQVVQTRSLRCWTQLQSTWGHGRPRWVSLRRCA